MKGSEIFTYLENSSKTDGENREYIETEENKRVVLW